MAHWRTFPQHNDMAAFIGRMLPQVHAQSQHAKVAHHVLSAYQRTFVRVMRAQLGPRATPGGLEVCPSTEVTSTEVTSMGLRRIIIVQGMTESERLTMMHTCHWQSSLRVARRLPHLPMQLAASSQRPWVLVGACLSSPSGKTS